MDAQELREAPDAEKLIPLTQIAAEIDEHWADP
jgi:hypothetical protein